MSKEGFFEWIANYTQIEDYVKLAHEKLLGDSAFPYQPSDVRLLEIGCGTSTLSESLQAVMKFGEVIAIDIDEGCINHMKNQFKHHHSKVSYYCYDMTADHTQHKHYNEMDDLNSFHIIIDKGTFDAILVEGSVASMIYNVLRLLAINGIYLLFSINKSLLLEELFEYTPFGLRCVHINTVTISNQVICIMILKKEFHSLLSLSEIQDHEREVMDMFFQIESPFLNDENEQRIKEQFLKYQKENENKGKEEGIDLPSAYQIIFEDKPDLGYDYSLFLEDIRNISLKNPNKMTYEEAMTFIQLMQ
jgi:hypothetical protein